MGFAVQPALSAETGSEIIAGDAEYSSPQAAYEEGLRAYNADDLHRAIPALWHASDNGNFRASFYLAEILSSSDGNYTDHVEAYRLYSDIVSKFSEIESADYRAQFVARSQVKLALYLMEGLPEIDLQPSPTQARRQVYYAAAVFNHPYAQFEYAKMLLQGIGGPLNARGGKHWLSVLTKRGHAGAQAYLAELFWDGKHLKQRRDYALALSIMAVRNAPKSDRIWIDENHQQMYCSSSEELRRKARQLVRSWEKKFRGEKIYPRSRRNTFQGLQASRDCAGGFRLDEEFQLTDEGDQGGNVPLAEDRSSATLQEERNRLKALHGSLVGFGGVDLKAKTKLTD